MQKITQITGKTVSLAMNDIDTDLIIPAQYLTSTTKNGYGKYLFKRLRENDMQFVFNHPQFNNASILITQNNFGCGSSREHAVWALQEAGIKAIIAISFADIFLNNAAKNGLVLITFSPGLINQMITISNNGNDYLTIDIATKKLSSIHFQNFIFDMDPYTQYCLLNGMDDLDYLLNHSQKIEDYKNNRGAL